MIHGPKTGHAAALAAAMAALLSAPALAGGHPDKAKIDLNGDGRIDLAEIQTARPDFTVERFNAADANRDGQLSDEEWRGGHAKRNRYGDLDTDKDGNFTLEELRAARPDLSAEDYAAFDSNRDGKVSQGEVKLTVADKMFKGMDTDGDGGVSLSEMNAVRSSVTQEKFARMDTDGNGVLSKEEMRAAHKKHRRKGDRPQEKPVEPPSGG